MCASHLEGNAFTGPIPDFMATLSKLDTLWLFGNQLSGAIPASLGNLKLMQSLRLEGNRLSGAIPDSLGSLPKLFSFHVENNAGLTGTLPRFAANIDCGAAGTQLCLATGVTASFCKLPFCDPSANVATSSASATSAGPSPTTIVGDSAASSSSSSSTLSTGAIAGIVAAGAVVFIAGVFLVARARKRAAEDAGRGYSLPSHKRGDRRAVVEVGGPRV
nr:hypothetical protein HK105_000391 [Polyrhizophydium stewartii]